MDGGINPASVHLTEVFHKLFPVYLSYGMNYSQYWYEDPELAIAYREAHKRTLTDQNYMAWLTGAYVNAALNANLSHMTSKHSRAEYPKEPFELFDFRTEEEQVEDMKEKAKRWLEMLVAGGSKWQSTKT